MESTRGDAFGFGGLNAELGECEQEMQNARMNWEFAIDNMGQVREDEYIPNAERALAVIAADISFLTGVVAAADRSVVWMVGDVPFMPKPDSQHKSYQQILEDMDSFETRFPWKPLEFGLPLTQPMILDLQGRVLANREDFYITVLNLLSKISPRLRARLRSRDVTMHNLRMEWVEMARYCVRRSGGL